MDSNSDKYAQKEAAYRAACVTDAEMGSGMAGAAHGALGTAYTIYRPYGHFETADQQLLQTAIHYVQSVGASNAADDILTYADKFLSFIQYTGTPTA